MDTLTHGLLGALLGLTPLRRIDRADAGPRFVKASVLVAVIAAELPDVDYLLPASDAVLHTLKAHRGMTHAIAASPAVALVAAVIVKLIYRDVRFAPLYARALLAVPLAHLLPDLWTGWGTRLFLPFSDTRVALDWTMVIDPFFTLPLAIGAAWALRRKSRRALFAGAGAAFAYLVLRVMIAVYLESSVRAAYPAAVEVHVFPAPLAVSRWRYVAELEGEYASGVVSLGRAPEEQSRLARGSSAALPDELASVATVREALAWARFPIVRVEPAEDSARRIRVADLRYHLEGKPTLEFVITVDEKGAVTEANLERGGTAGELFRRWFRSER